MSEKSIVPAQKALDGEIVSAADVLDRRKAPSTRFEDYLIFSDFVGAYDVVLDFMVVQVVGDLMGPEPGTLYTRIQDGTSDYPTTDPAAADVFLVGRVKWDGCSDWDFPGIKDCMLHFCGAKHATSIGRLMQKIYEITAERMPKFDRDLADMDPTKFETLK